MRGDHGKDLERHGGGPSRRAVLLSGVSVAVIGGVAGGYELVQAGVLPGKYALARLDGACGSAPPAPPGPLPTRHDVTFQSAYRHRAVTMVTLIPAGQAARSRRLGVVVGLHGAGADARRFATQLAPAMVLAGTTDLAAVTVDGGDTYWHKRFDGDDPLGMIRHEVLPRLAAAGLRTDRIAVVGVSMGGYGALLMAEQFAGGRPMVAGVAALSPAIFASYADAVAASRMSFDSPADFARHDVIVHAAALRSVPTWIGCGTADPFESQTARLRARLAAVTGHTAPGGIRPGCHDDAFSARNLPAALTFLGQKTEEGR